jgi:hypothetical protein
MKKEAIALMLLLALSMMPILATTTSAHVIGTSYPTGIPSLTVDWAPGGQAAAENLSWNPEFIQLETSGYTTITHDTTIILQGQDTYGQNVEAKVFLPAGTQPESYFTFNDTDTYPPEPVAFAKITNIFQQNGTHNDQFYIMTEPSPAVQSAAAPKPGYMMYLGQYHLGTGWQPGAYTDAGNIYPYNLAKPWTNLYLHANGPEATATTQNVAPEPITPDPLIVYINWHETDGDLYPNSQYDSRDTMGTAKAPAWLYIEGLDQNGNKVGVNVTIPYGASSVPVPTTSCTGENFTFSSVCNVVGNYSDSYYLLTNPTPSVQLFTYTTLIDHMNIYPGSYDILANPGEINGLYPGVTNVTIELVDQDGNPIHACPNEQVDLNFATTGGTIEPSCDVWMNGTITATVNLTADTNPRTVNVTADADVPPCVVGKTPTSAGITISPELDLFAWTELTFDGVNSVFSLAGQAWPIHTLLWGYNTQIGPWGSSSAVSVSSYTGNAPPEPPLPAYLGGPDPANAPYTVKFDGPLYEVSIPLYVGCNLISSPVIPMMNYNLTENGTAYYGSAYFGDPGIPMSLLFGNTSATETVEMVWWYCGTSWYYYVPLTGLTNAPSGTAYFTDGLGYWIMCDKPCTLEISGVAMQNAPFTPPVYELPERSWSLMGVTSINGYPNYADYLESTLAGEEYTGTVVTVGPIWVWNAQYRYWTRDPSWGLWPTMGFWIYNALPEHQEIAP